VAGLISISAIGYPNAVTQVVGVSRIWGLLWHENNAVYPTGADLQA
jgi:hypothetical protein